MKRTAYRAPANHVPPLYARAGRIVHTFLNHNLSLTRVTDDFGNSVEVDKDAVLWFIRGPRASYQPNY